MSANSGKYYFGFCLWLSKFYMWTCVVKYLGCWGTVRGALIFFILSMECPFMPNWSIFMFAVVANTTIILTFALFSNFYCWKTFFYRYSITNYRPKSPEHKNDNNNSSNARFCSCTLKTFSLGHFKCSISVDGIS